MLKMTALHWAVEHGHQDVVELLIKYGADVHTPSKFCKTAFDIAVDNGDEELMLMLQVIDLIQSRLQIMIKMDYRHKHHIIQGNCSKLMVNCREIKLQK